MNNKVKILISDCILGTNCKYNGKNNLNLDVLHLKEKYQLIPVCPEVFGGLSIPRKTSEIKNGKVIHNDMTDVTKEFIEGAMKTLNIAKENSCKIAILKAKSPSCGFGEVYDGTFTSTLINGNGIAADLLYKNGIVVLNETNFREYLK